MPYNSRVRGLLFVRNKLFTVNYSDLHLGQTVFTHNGKQWRAELIDWEYAEIEEGKLRQNPRKSFGFPQNSKVYVPPLEAFEAMDHIH
jgi:hypothetical protein